MGSGIAIFLLFLVVVAGLVVWFVLGAVRGGPGDAEDDDRPAR